ncbi:uncharacterized protein LOC141659831 isoform X2 [Apium graveolens]|uniref:uncharacterized protein LOC141659831 isoform X2 n=1 Tax=Apium graveolens TaxID=4045 RepID=UPI003D78DA7D
MEKEITLINLCVIAATETQQAVEKWRKQRRTLERLPSHLAEALVHRLVRKRLMFPSLLEVFKNTLEKIDLSGQSTVDLEWMAYLGAFTYLNSLNLAGCPKISSSAIWPIAGMKSLKKLNLSRCPKITDAGIKHLLSIPTLEELSISQTGVTSDGVSLLSSLKNLSLLDLGGLPVIDAALCSLQVLTKLQYLDLWGSEVSNVGASVLKMFPKLIFLNLAWSKVSKLPILSSIVFLNMSNCITHSIFEGHGDKVHLRELILTGATIVNVLKAFSYVDTSSLTLLDVSNSSLQEFNFLSCLVALEHLDLSSCPISDDLIQIIAHIGAKLRFLNLSNTKVSSAGVSVLVGRVPKLETILLANTPIDDLAISHLSAMPSLKVINLSGTNIKGQIQQLGSGRDTVPSLAELQNLSCLEMLYMENTQLRDGSLNPISNLHKLNHLYLGGPLTDMSLCRFSSIESLTHLSLHDAVFTGQGLKSFKPPSYLKVLDLSGCWLLTKDDLFLFSQRNPQIELKHELYHFVPSEQSISKYLSTSGVPTKTGQSKKKERKLVLLPEMLKKDDFIDQRLKYSREELLALQASSLSLVAFDKGNLIPEMQ